MRHLTTVLSMLACRSQPAGHHGAASPTRDATAVLSAQPRWHHPSPGLSWAQTEVPFDDARDLLGTPVTGRRLTWIVVRLRPLKLSLLAERAPHATLNDVTSSPNVLLAIDSGFFNSDMSPSGLLIARGAQIAPLTQGGGSGVLRVHQGHADVLTRHEASDAGPGAELAVQCGPRLVERGAIIGIHRDDGHRFARTAACVRDDGRTLDLVLTWDKDLALSGPGLMRFAQRLAGPSPVGDPRGCEAALNLDGGPSTGVYVRETPAGQGFLHAALGPTPWLITARE